MAGNIPRKRRRHGLTLAFFAGVVVGIIFAPPRSISINNNIGKVRESGRYHWDETMGNAGVTKVD